LAFDQGRTLQVAEKLDLICVLKGRSFSCAVQVIYFCHHEATLVAEGYAFSTFSAACWVRASSDQKWKGHVTIANRFAR
jgi:hypothetical protein